MLLKKDTSHQYQKVPNMNHEHFKEEETDDKLIIYADNAYFTGIHRDMSFNDLKNSVKLLVRTMNGLSFDNYLQHKYRMELGIEASHYEGIVKYIESTGMMSLMEDYNLTWEAVYNIVKESVEDG